MASTFIRKVLVFVYNLYNRTGTSKQKNRKIDGISYSIGY